MVVRAVEMAPVTFDLFLFLPDPSAQKRGISPSTKSSLGITASVGLGCAYTTV